MNNKFNDDLEKIEEDLRRKAEERQKEDMPVSGRSVFKLRAILKKKQEENNKK
ncbi:MAG TPA: hypothetical protein PK263_05125 [bacterium]|nr:hypothetical protein [bacterium]